MVTTWKSGKKGMFFSDSQLEKSKMDNVQNGKMGSRI